MLLRIFTEPQLGASYDTLLAVARASESLGFDAFFRSDHYLSMGSASGLPGPSDAWTTLAGIARETSTIRLGTLVTSATFRLPGPLAIIVAGVDTMSGGRVELGLGAGWYEAEHTAYGIPFPPVGRALRASRGAAGPDHRAVGDARRGHLHPGGRPLPDGRQPGPAQADPAARAADHRGRARGEAHPPVGRHLRRRVQPGLLVAGGDRRPSSSGCGPPARPGGEIPTRWSTRRPRSSAAGVTEAEVGRPGPGHRARGRRPARPTACAARPRRWWPSWPPTPRWGPSACTCRSSTSPTSTTWPSSPRQVLPHCASL